MERRRRVYALLTACLLMLAVAFSVLCLAVESNHDCTGEDCSICRILALCENTVKTVGAFLCAVGIVLFVADYSASHKLSQKNSEFSYSPVFLKVKLLN